MGKFVDFVIKFDPEKEDLNALTEKVLYALFVRRLKYKKPTICFIGGDSGEGKSYTGLSLMFLLFKIQGINYLNWINQTNVYTPLQYAQKLKEMLDNPEMLKVNSLTVHESRELVGAANWHTFLNQTISTVNAMCRVKKRICFFIISQFIKDVDKNIRHTLNYYITVYRPLGEKPQIRIELIYKDDKDLERPRLKKRLINGYLVDNAGRYRHFRPKYLVLNKPPKEVIEIFDKEDLLSKGKIINAKLEKLIKKLSLDLDIKNPKVDAMISYYTEDPNRLTAIGQKTKGRWKLKPEVKLMHDLTDSEITEFSERLNIKIKELGLV